MEIDSPMQFEEALEKLRRREVVPSGLDSAGWAEVAVGIRERAFFSSRVESARVLNEMKRYMENWLENARMENGGLVAQGRAEFVAEMRELAIREGLGRVDAETGLIDPEIDENDLTDIRSQARLQLIFDTQAEAAQEFGFWQQGQDEDVLAVFPAQRFIRVRPVETPRPIHAANEGAVRRKDDLAFWLAMNEDFGVPWGPWGFNSGMGVEDVDAIEAEELGVIKRGEKVKPVEKKFNEGLEAGVKELDGGLLAALRRAVGGEVAEGKLKKTQDGKTQEARRDAWPERFDSVDAARAVFADRLGVRNVAMEAPDGDWKTWGTKFKSKKAALAHLHEVGAEFDRLVAEYPGLKGKLDQFLCVESERGASTPPVSGMSTKMSTKTKEWKQSSWDWVKNEEKKTGHRKGMERQGSQVRDNFRHEMGHVLSTPAAMNDWSALKQKEGWKRQWVLDNLSEYAGFNEYEEVAEAFSLFTRKDYVAGTLPATLEDFLKNLTK